MTKRTGYLRLAGVTFSALLIGVSLAGCDAGKAANSSPTAAVGAPGAPGPHAKLAAELGLPWAESEAQGFSTAGLDALHHDFRKLVDDKKLAGVTTLVARHGKVVHLDTYGKADATAGTDLKPDSIFRIASMTKPTVGVAMMQLYEQGKWKLDDPVSKYIPEFAGLRVKTKDGKTEPQKSPMTMAQLMSHTAGFGVSAVYEKNGLQDGDLKAMIDKLAKLPLESQPGSDWAYGPSVNIQGYIVEKLSGQPLDQYLQDHVFGPLKMVDTGFFVAPDKVARLVAVHTYDEKGVIKTMEQQKQQTTRPVFLSGSGGLMSTAKDYFRFAQAMLNGGELEGARVLKPETVKLMHQNVLQPGVKVDLYGPAQEGIGFGLDFAIVQDPKAADSKQGVDTFYWGGAFGTWFWIDPTNDIVFVGMIQNLNGSNPDKGTPPVRKLSPDLTYAALTDPKK